MNDNRLIDENKKRADELQNILGISLSLPDNILSINSTNIISNPSREVNSLSSKNNDKITSNDGTRFSIRDSEGNQLSSEQAEFFKDSKVRDEDGNLMVVYHGTDKEFTVFDNTKGRANMDIQGMFFSPWEIEAGGYGKNVKAEPTVPQGTTASANALSVTDSNITIAELLNSVKSIFPNILSRNVLEHYNVERPSGEIPSSLRYSINEDSGMDSLYADVIRENQNLRWIFSQYDDIYSSRRLDISLNQDDNVTFDIAKSEDGRAILYATDGNIKKVGSAKVNSLKIKGSRQNSDFLDIIPQSNAGSQADIENNPQSENSYSINEDSGMDSLYADVIRENQNLRWIFSQYDDIYSSRRLDISLNQDDIDRVARTTLKKYSSKYDVNELSEKLTAVYDYLEQTAGRGQVDSETISNALFKIAKDILLRSERLDTEVYDSVKPAKIV